VNNENGLVVDPKWVASLYGLSATAVCILVFTYSSTDFMTALLKTFFTSIAFYLTGIVTSALINFIVLNFFKKKEKNNGAEAESAGSSEGTSESVEESR